MLEVSLNSRFLLIHLASVARYSVAILRSDALKLLHLLAEPRAAALPVRNGDVERFLKLRPHNGSLPVAVGNKPVELVLERAISVVFNADELRRDATTGYLLLVGP